MKKERRKFSGAFKAQVYWWGAHEKEKYHSKLDFVKDLYDQELQKQQKTDNVICIIKAIENTRTFANKEIKTKEGKLFIKKCILVINSFVNTTFTFTIKNSDCVI